MIASGNGRLLLMLIERSADWVLALCPGVLALPYNYRMRASPPFSAPLIIDISHPSVRARRAILIYLGKSVIDGVGGDGLGAVRTISGLQAWLTINHLGLSTPARASAHA